MFCVHCGKQIPDDSSFCTHCGQKQYPDGVPVKEIASKPIVQKKKMPWWAWLIIAWLVLAVILNAGRKESAPENTEPVVTQTAPAKTVTEDDSVAMIVEIVRKSAEENFDDISVTREGNMVVIDIAEDGLAAEAQMALKGDKSKRESWEVMTNSMLEFCAVVMNFFDEACVEDGSVLLNLRNDQNKENLLLCILNQEVVYDVINSK